MNEGDVLPSVTVATADGPLDLASLKGKAAVVYFYPKDDTPGCTQEAKDFSDLAEAFTQAGIEVVGISKDTPEKHAKFAAKHALTVRLASDTDGSACEAFGTWGEKQLYGKTYMGIERATFLFGEDGRLIRAWRKVKVPGHARAVLDAARELSGRDSSWPNSAMRPSVPGPDPRSNGSPHLRAGPTRRAGVAIAHNRLPRHTLTVRERWGCNPAGSFNSFASVSRAAHRFGVA